MNLLLVVTHGNVGGAQRNVVSIAKEMSKKGHDVFVLAGEGMWLIDQLSSAKITIIPAKTLERSWNPLKALAFMREMFNVVYENKIDVVHFHSSNAILGAIGVPKTVRKIATIHGLSLMTEGFTGSKIKKWMYSLSLKAALKSVDHVVFVCKADQKKLAVSESTVVYNGIDPEQRFYSREEAREKLEISTGVKLVGTLGRRAYAKNLAMFDELAYKFPDYTFINLADVSEEPVRFMKALDTFVLTSRFEGFPYVLLEAGLAQVPILSSDVGGVSELLEGDRGLMVPSNDYVAFVKGLSDLILHEGESKARAQRLFNKIKHDFSQEQMTDKLAEIYGV